MIWERLNSPAERPMYDFPGDSIKFLKSLIGIKYKYAEHSNKTFVIVEDFRGLPIISDGTRYYSDDYITIFNRFTIGKRKIKVLNNRFIKHKEAMCLSR